MPRKRSQITTHKDPCCDPTVWLSDLNYTVRTVQLNVHLLGRTQCRKRALGKTIHPSCMVDLKSLPTMYDERAANRTTGPVCYASSLGPWLINPFGRAKDRIILYGTPRPSLNRKQIKRVHSEGIYNSPRANFHTAVHGGELRHSRLFSLDCEAAQRVTLLQVGHWLGLAMSSRAR